MAIKAEVAATVVEDDQQAGSAQPVGEYHASAVHRANGAAGARRNQYAVPFRPRIVAALDIGQLTLGVVGADGRLEFTIIGNVVNRVSKLEKHARKLGVSGVASAKAFNAAFPDGAPGGLVTRRYEGETVAGLNGALDVIALAAAR